MARIAPVRFGIIGAGRIARHQMAPALKLASNAELFAAASRDIKRAKALKPKRAYADYDALLNDPDVEAVYIATHNGLHCPLTLRALECGKHVICEKPLAASVSECSEMLASARQHGRLLMEAFMYRYHPQIAKAAQLIQAGTIGDMHAVEASFSFKLSEPQDVRWKAGWGGGSLLDVGCYCVNACRFFINEEPLAVTAMLNLHPVHGVDISAHGILQFSRQRFGVVSCGFDGGLRNRVLISGSDGTIELPSAFVSSGKDCDLLIHRNGKGKRVAFRAVNVFLTQIEDFARAIRTGRNALLPPDEGLKNAHVFRAFLASAKKGLTTPV